MPMGLLKRPGVSNCEWFNVVRIVNSFMAGQTQHPCDNKSYFFSSKKSETRIEFPAPFAMNVQLRMGKLLFYRLIQHSGSPNIKPKFRDQFPTTMLK